MIASKKMGTSVTRPHALDFAHNPMELRSGFLDTQGHEGGSETQAMVILVLEVAWEACFMLIHGGKHLRFKHFSVASLLN